ncbi:hypothetical protein HKK74_36855 [Actinomadura alba]|uniref:Peptidase n=1 Tax=Actinomadura alba TaxID=406431 RepID=A0ABR7M1V5_9ACTN|nr:hypothetical protein [Actinomadura alba]
MVGGTTGAAHASADRPSDGLGIRLLDAPVSRRKDPRARTGVVDHLNPGTTITRRFEVSNTTRRSLRVALYAAAADVENRTFAFAPERTPNELTTWTTVEPAEIDLPPHHKRTGRFTIRVPKTAWRGERYAMIWAQTGAPPDKNHNLGLLSRVGIRIYLDIGPGGEPPSDMRIEKLTPERDAAGRPRLVAQVRNTGGRALDLSGRLSLTDGPEGIRAGPYPATLGVTLKPGDTGQVVVEMGKRLPNGPWKAHLVIQSGLVKRVVSANVTFPDTGIGRSAVLLGTRHMLFPSALVALTLAVAAVVLLLLRRRRRRVNSGSA